MAEKEPSQIKHKIRNFRRFILLMRTIIVVITIAFVLEGLGIVDIPGDLTQFSSILLLILVIVICDACSEAGTGEGGPLIGDSG